MLYTNLKHLENSIEHAQAIHANKNAVITCGRIEYGCINVFRMMEELEVLYPDVMFYDMEYDNPESKVICSLPEISGSSAIPFVVCYKNRKVAHSSSGILSREEMISLLKKKFMNPTKQKSTAHTTKHITY